MTYTEYSALLYFFDESYIYENWDSHLVFWILYARKKIGGRWGCRPPWAWGDGGAVTLGVRLRGDARPGPECTAIVAIGVKTVDRPEGSFARYKGTLRGADGAAKEGASRPANLNFCPGSYSF